MKELKRIRNERGWSQQKLADEAQINKVTLVHIETGKTSPNVDTLDKLALALEVEIGDFFPKAQAQLWQDPSPEQGPKHSFRFAAQGIEEFCEHWTERLQDPDLSYQSLRDFLVSFDGWLSVFEVALNTELHELRTIRTEDVNWESGFTEPHNSSIFMRLLDVALIPTMNIAFEIADKQFDQAKEESELEAAKRRKSIIERTRRIAS